jgi:hypothetical protein
MKSEIFEGLSEKTLLARPYQSSKAKGRGQNALFDGNTLNPRYKGGAFLFAKIELRKAPRLVFLRLLC